MLAAAWFPLLVLTVALAGGGVVALNRGLAERDTVRERTVADRLERRSHRPTNRLDAWLRRTQPGRDVEARLKGAGLSWRVVDFLALNVAAAGAGYLLLGAVLPLWLTLPGAAAAVWGCWRFLEWKRGRRRDELIAQLPELARTVSNGASAGLSMVNAIELAADELGDPAGTELATVARELRVGQSLAGAMENLQRRVPSREVAVLVSTIVIQQRAGGDIVDALRSMGETLDDRRELHREIRTIMSGAVASGYVVITIGVGAVVMFNVLQPGTLEQLAETGIGRIVVVISAGLFTAGILAMRHLAKVEV